MPWDENRRLKITLLREQPTKQNIVVEFEIAEVHRINFQKALEYLLAAFINAGGEIKDCVSVNDGDTKKPTSMEILVMGSQEKLVNELNKSIGELKAYSVRSR